MLRFLVRAVPVMGFVLLVSSAVCPSATAAERVIVEDRVIAGGPDRSLEVRHLVLRGTNEQIGKALAELAKERYGARAQRANDPLQVRALREFLERNDPILLERMRGVASAYGKSIDDDEWDFSSIGFVDLKAGCSIVHLPPASMANGKSVVSRDYDFTTGTLSYGFLPKGMLHPTARPYLLELHPDRGYASIAMVSYDLLSGVIDGINSEGLTVTMAMDVDLRRDQEGTRVPAVGLGELQIQRLLLDTCADVEEAKRTLMATKQYYQYVPIHYLIADRYGHAFVWEYSRAHNPEFIVENPGRPLVLTNSTLHTRLEDGKAPSSEKMKGVCKRYAYLSDKLATGNLDDRTIRDFHQRCDAQASQAADTTEPPERTFWHAFYYPEDRRVRLSYYLGDEPYPGQPRLVKPIRTDYLEFQLEPTGGIAGKQETRAATAATAKPQSSGPRTSAGATAAPPPATPPPATAAGSPASAAAPATPSSRIDAADVPAAIEAAGGDVKLAGKRVIGVSLGDKVTGVSTVLPLLLQLPDLEQLTLANPAVTDADVRGLAGLPKLVGLGLMGAPVGDAALEVLKSLPALRQLNLSGTKITDAGLAHLENLTSLEYLGLKGTGITDAGLARLKRLDELTNLNLADTKVSDAGLVHLAGLARLESINLSNDDVSDAGLAHVSRMPSLAGLNVTGTKVTDAGLVYLKQLPKLSKLNVTGTAVTEQGVKDAKKFLPFWASVTR